MMVHEEFTNINGNIKMLVGIVFIEEIIFILNLEFLEIWGIIF